MESTLSSLSMANCLWHTSLHGSRCMHSHTCWCSIGRTSFLFSCHAALLDTFVVHVTIALGLTPSIAPCSTFAALSGTPWTQLSATMLGSSSAFRTTGGRPLSQPASNLRQSQFTMALKWLEFKLLAPEVHCPFTAGPLHAPCLMFICESRCRPLAQGRDPVASLLGARAEDNGICVQRHPLRRPPGRGLL